MCPSVCVRTWACVQGRAALAKAAPPEPHCGLKKGGPEEVAEAGLAYPRLQRQHWAPARPPAPHPLQTSSSLRSSGCASSHHPTGPARQGPQGQPHHQESLHLQAQGRAPSRKNCSWQGGCRPEVLCLPLGGTSHPREGPAPSTVSRDGVKQACAPPLSQRSQARALCSDSAAGEARGKGRAPWGGVGLSAARPAHSDFPTQQHSPGQRLRF